MLFESKAHPARAARTGRQVEKLDENTRTLSDRGQRNKRPLASDNAAVLPPRESAISNRELATTVIKAYIGLEPRPPADRRLASNPAVLRSKAAALQLLASLVDELLATGRRIFDQQQLSTVISWQGFAEKLLLRGFFDCLLVHELEFDHGILKLSRGRLGFLHLCGMNNQLLADAISDLAGGGQVDFTLNRGDRDEWGEPVDFNDSTGVIVLRATDAETSNDE